PCFKHSAKKAATCSRRQTTLSTGSSDGSWTPKATRSSSGSHRLGSERSLRQVSTSDLQLRRLKPYSSKPLTYNHLPAFFQIGNPMGIPGREKRLCAATSRLML